MSKTLFDLTYELARSLNVLKEGLATGGSTTTAIDTVERTEADDYWNGGAIWLTYDAGGAGAAPQGEYGFISDFVQSTGVITIRTALTAAIASGDRYAVATSRYPLELLIQKINQVLGTIEKTDVTSITIAAAQTEYSLPADVMSLKQVWIQTKSDDSDDNGWEQIHDWYKQKSATGSADKLILKRQFEAGFDVKLVYEPYHAVLRAATDKLDDSLNSNQIVADAAVRCLLWRKSKVGDSDLSVNDLLNFYQNAAELLKQEYPKSKPKKHAKTIHPVFNRP
jgi:hypothetical protein